MQAIFDRLATPTATQLYVASVRAGLAVSKKQAQDFVARQADKQLFARGPKSDLQTATRSETSDHQIDLVDLKQLATSSSFKVILFVCNPWNRKIAMEGLTSKAPLQVAQGYRRILNRMPKPQVVSSDLGAEWGGAFAGLLEEKNIKHRYKDPRNANSLAVMDRQIQSAKLALFKLMTRKNTTKWDSFIDQVEASHNETVQGALLGAPNDTEGDSNTAKIERFALMKANAEKFESNHDKAQKRDEAIRTAGQYRVAKKPGPFDRSFKPRYETEVRTVREVKAGMVRDDTGRAAVPSSAVVAVPAGTAEGPVPDFAGRTLRDNRLKETLRPFARDLYDALGNQELAVTAAARMMPPEYNTTRPSTLLFSTFLRYFPTLFKVTGQGPAMKVRRTGRKLQGKQAVGR